MDAFLPTAIVIIAISFFLLLISYLLGKSFNFLKPLFVGIVLFLIPTSLSIAQDIVEAKQNYLGNLTYQKIQTHLLVFYKPSVFVAYIFIVFILILFIYDLITYILNYAKK